MDNQNDLKNDLKHITFLDSLRNIGSRRLLAMLLCIVLAAGVITAVSISFYNVIKNSIELRGEYTTLQSAELTEKYMTSGRYGLLISADVLETLLRSGAEPDTVYQFLSDESERIADSIDQDFSGLYGVFNGTYLTTTGFEPDSTFDPKQRPWYIEAVKSKGNPVFVDPYVDARTGNMVITIAKQLSDAESVVALDIPLDEMQKIVDSMEQELEGGSAIILDSRGDVVAHSDRSEVGHNYLDETDSLGSLIAPKIYEDQLSSFDVSFDGNSYVVYNSGTDTGWHSVSILVSRDFYSTLDLVVIISCVLILAIIIIIMMIFIRISRQSLLSRNLNLQLSAMADIYNTVVDIDLQKDTFIEIVNKEDLSGVMVRNHTRAQETMNSAANLLAAQAFHPVLLDFLDLSKVPERLANKANISLEFMDNTRGWLRGSLIAAERDRSGKVIRVLWAIESIDDEKRLREELIQKAQIDQMTGIFNRASGEHQITEHLSRLENGMFILLDVDNFKSINDRFGHGTGDKVLIAVAGSLKNAFRNGDTVMRLGGDEFAAYAPGVFDQHICDSIVNRFFSYLNNVSIPEMQGEPVYVSIGAAFCPRDNAVSFNDLYEGADKCTYESKKIPGSRITCCRI